MAGSRRPNRFAGGGSSNHSGSLNRAATQAAGGPNRLFGQGAAGASGSGFNDILDSEMTKEQRPGLTRGRSTNLLSDAGSKYGGDDDNISHYMGQSQLGGASVVGGAADVGSNLGGYTRGTHASAGGTADPALGRSTTSRRQ